jgi:hypothetical protein
MKLFNFKFINFSNDEINNYLKTYGLFSFQNRVIFRIFIFTFKIKSSKNAPLELKNQIKIVEHQNAFYNLRSNGNLQVTSNRSLTKNGDKTFNYIFSKIINNFFTLFNESNLKNFQSNLLLNLNLYVVKFISIDIFCKFNLNLNFYFYS